MSADVMLATLTPGFQRFLVVIALLVVAAIVLAIVSAKATPHTARRASAVNRYLLLTMLALIVLFPIYVTVVNSLLRPDVIGHRPPTLFPTHPLWNTYSSAWSDGHLGRYLFNSFFVTLLIVIGQIITAVLAAYAFAFLAFPLKRFIFVLFLSTLMVPAEVTFFTNYQTVSSFRNVPVLGTIAGYNTYGALVVPFLATGFGAFLIRQAFMSLPRDLRDAAALDGYGHWRFMTRVAVPLARPAIASLALFSFFGAWNQYLWPLVVTNDDNHRTVQIGLRQLAGASVDRINVTFAGTILAALPLFVLLLVFQKQLVRGLTAGAVKG
ncbi:MAG: ABC-type sugar transport system, permease component [Actinomycetia bacterium]|jgi:sn-glycerol 3-phosphate transport system permease protein|nr:ABC-type sugar transport system, permease component [Actinomycetes bacterium]